MGCVWGDAPALRLVAKGQRETGSRAGDAVARHIHMMAQGDFPRDGQPQTGAARMADGMLAVEAVEDVRQILRRSAAGSAPSPEERRSG